MEKSGKKELVNSLKEKISLVKLTSAQRRLLFVQLFEQENAFYNNFAIFRVDNIDYECFKQAIDLIVSQSILLRSKIVNVAGNYYFCEIKDFKCKINKADFSNESKDKLNDAIDKEIQKVFRFDQIGLYKISFYQYKNEVYLVFNFHHILLDGWSLGLFFKALTKYYNLLIKSNEIRVEEYVLSDNFSKFSAEEYIEQIKYGERRKSYWKKRLDKYCDFEFPLDKTRPNRNKYVGKKKELLIDGTIYADFINICKENRVTVFSGLITAFYLLLMMYTKQKDITLGTVHANRLSTEYEKTIGTFLNTLPVRIQFDEFNMSFIECAKKVQNMLFQDQLNQIPFNNLVEALSLKRDSSKNALFQILFIFQNMQFSLPKFENSKIEYLSEYHNNSSRVDLEMHIWEKEKKFIAYLFYNSELFHDETIDLLLYHYVYIIKKVTVHVGDISKINLPPVDVASIIPQNVTDEYKKYDICKGLDEVIEKTPDKVAIVFEAQHITYSAFGELVDFYEKNILALKYKKNYLLGVYMDRTIEMVAILHAILRSGCGYVPIERSLPKERIIDIIEDTKVEYVIHNINEEDEALNEIKNESNAKFLSIKQFKDYENWQPEKIKDNDLAYIIYTSGSTGKTKGVMLTRNNLQSYIYTFRKKVPDNGTWLALTNYNFDPSVIELIWTLYYGNRIVLTLGNSKQFLTEGKARKLIKNCHVSHIQMVPTLSKLVFDGTSNDELNTLKCILLGGEYSTKSLLENIRRNSTAKIINVYGPTETTIWMSFHEISNQNETNVLGEVLNNVVVKILDENKQNVPQNVPGELYVGGPCVSKGYMNREELVKEKYSLIDGMRFYQTGDICKIDSKNRLILLGRNDRQVKMNGFRIELDEIETDIMMISKVKACSVQLCGAENPELVAFISISNNAEKKMCLNEIKELLKRKVPFYMIPTQYVFMKMLPTNTNGKTDVKKLKEYYISHKEETLKESILNTNSNSRKRINNARQWINKVHYEMSEKISPYDGKECNDIAVIFTEIGNELSDIVISKIKQVYSNTVIVGCSESYCEIADGYFGINIRKLEDYQKIYESVLKDNKKTVNIFSLWGINKEDDYNTEKFNGKVIDYFYFLKSICLLDTENIKVGLIALNSVFLGENSLCNYNFSFLHAASVCFSLENKKKKCALIDIDNSMLNGDDFAFVGIIQDFNVDRRREYIVRNSHYYDAVFEQIPFQKGEVRYEIKHSSAIIIFGGLSGIGLEMATFLSTRTNLGFVLVARTELPDKTEWEKIIFENTNENKKIIETLKKIQQIENNGCNVIVKKADVTCVQDLINLDKDLADLQVCVKGVIYSVAKGNTGYLITTKEENVRLVLEAKTTGVSNVMEIFGEQADFLILNSSLCSKLGGAAAYDYCVANAGLDSFANFMNGKGLRVFNFSWDTWKETGMAYNASIRMKNDFDTEEILNDGITNDEASILFDMLFTNVFYGDNQRYEFFISVYSMMERYNERFEKTMFEPTKLSENMGGIKDTFGICEKFEFSENIMREIWRKILNTDNFTNADNFFDVGGNSIMLIHVQNMLKKVTGDDVPLNILYNYPTIETFSSYMIDKNNSELGYDKSKELYETTLSNRKRLNKRLNKMKGIKDV